MLFEPNERKATLEGQQFGLANAEKSDNVQIFVLEDVNASLLQHYRPIFLMFLSLSVPFKINQVFLKGHSRRPVTFAVREFRCISDVFNTRHPRFVVTLIVLQSKRHMIIIGNDECSHRR